MRVIVALLSAVLLVSGCAHRRPSSDPAPAKKPAKPVITPDLQPEGRIQNVNLPGRFVVVSFRGGPMPNLRQILGVYRNGLKIGEIRITGPQADVNTVADIVTGEVQLQDEVKPD